MKMIENVLTQLTDTDPLLEWLHQTIADMDADYEQEQDAYRHGAQALIQEVPGAEEYLAAQKQELASNVRYAIWLGFQWNLECFRNPVNKLLLYMDLEELYQEPRMQTLPEAQLVRQKINTFLQALPKEKLELLDPIIDHYAYLKTYAYKLAHYAGFCLADKLLPNLVPGYTNDPRLTIRYAQKIEMALGRNVV